MAIDRTTELAIQRDVAAGRAGADSKVKYTPDAMAYRREIERERDLMLTKYPDAYMIVPDDLPEVDQIVNDPEYLPEPGEEAETKESDVDLAEKDDGHFFGAWKGGSARSGGGPAGTAFVENPKGVPGSKERASYVDQRLKGLMDEPDMQANVQIRTADGRMVSGRLSGVQGGEIEVRQWHDAEKGLSPGAKGYGAGYTSIPIKTSDISHVQVIDPPFRQGPEGWKRSAKPIGARAKAEKQMTQQQRWEAEYKSAVAGKRDTWVVANQGKEPVFTHNGGRFQYVFNPKTGKHGYLDLGTDMVVKDYKSRELVESADAALIERWVASSLSDIHGVEVDLGEKAGSDHFYGAWKGGSAKSGGGPAGTDKDKDGTYEGKKEAGAAKGGKYTVDKTVSPDEAVAALQRGERPSVEAKDVGTLMEKFHGREDHLDLTEVHVNGTPTFGLDGLGIARKDMPQIPPERAQDYLADLRRRGISVTEVKLDPRELNPIQKEVSATNCARIFMSMREQGVTGSIWSTSDGFVIDGHHRWGAATALAFEKQGVLMPSFQIGLTAREALKDAENWSVSQGIAKRGIGESKAPLYDAAADAFEIREAARLGGWPDLEVLADLAEKSGDGHFYGAWKGGKASSGGGPAGTDKDKDGRYEGRKEGDQKDHSLSTRASAGIDDMGNDVPNLQAQFGKQKSTTPGFSGTKADEDRAMAALQRDIAGKGKAPDSQVSRVISKGAYKSMMGDIRPGENEASFNSLRGRDISATFITGTSDMPVAHTVTGQLVRVEQDGIRTRAIVHGADGRTSQFHSYNTVSIGATSEGAHSEWRQARSGGTPKAPKVTEPPRSGGFSPEFLKAQGFSDAEIAAIKSPW